MKLPRNLSHVLDQLLGLKKKETVTYSEPGYPPGFLGFPWGGRMLPPEAAHTHMAILGATGSGKSVHLKIFLESVFPLIGKGYGHRMCLYDPKTEFPSVLFATLPPQAKLFILHPFDARSVRWKIAADFDTPALQMQLADMLVPHAESDNNRYFADAARDLIRGVMLALHHHAPGAWSFRHLVLFCSGRLRLKKLLQLIPETADLARKYLDAKSSRDVLATLATHLAPFAIIAATQEHATREFSQKEFLSQEGVLVIGHSDEVTAALSGLNRLFIRRLSENVLKHQLAAGGRTWFVFDEFSQLSKHGKVQGLHEIAAKGRSSGATIVLATQDVNFLDHAYGKSLSRDLLGSLLTKAFFRAESDELAEFASNQIGKQEVIVTLTNSSIASTGGQHPSTTTTTSNQKQLMNRVLVMPDEVRNLPRPCPVTDQIVGYFRSPSTGSYRGVTTFVKELQRLRRAPHFPDFVPISKEHQRLAPLHPGDLQKLNLPKSFPLE